MSATGDVNGGNEGADITVGDTNWARPGRLRARRATRSDHDPASSE